MPLAPGDGVQRLEALAKEREKQVDRSIRSRVAMQEALDYGYRKGILVDHRQVDPLALIESARAGLPLSGSGGLPSESKLPVFVPHTSIDIDERLDVTRGAAEMLKSVHQRLGRTRSAYSQRLSVARGTRTGRLSSLTSPAATRPT